jgi:acyl transferase domain-containing protein/pimeloyl-ACP methyl ester carboxylesterase/aryl carrier-like protein
VTSAANTELLSEALAEIRELRTRLENIERAHNEPIAIIGMACRMPGAPNLGAFWEFVRDGRDATADIPPDRFDIDKFYDPDPAAPGKSVTRRGAFLKDIDGFDAAFFGVSPREAAHMDPQQRLFLEVCWEALEHAAQPIQRLTQTPTGVFMGVSAFDYLQAIMQRYPTAALDAYCLTGGATATFTPGRLAYFLGLQGPSLSVDTACSSSLVALHLAVQSLHAGDCTMALAGGVNLLLAPETFVVLSKLGMMSPDGRCKTFDASANGYVRGEGCGVLVLKPLSRALADCDRVLAVIRGTAVNQDGRSSGITVPNGSAQRAVIRDALRRAGTAGRDIDYVETHGTGTALGDPIEVQALCDVLGEARDPERPVILGSVKTNIGHLEPAAGVASVIKTVLALRNEQIPPLLHLTQINPEIRADRLPITIPTEARPWPRSPRPRSAGVSSFGASGTNAHIVLQEPPDDDRPEQTVDRPSHLICISARTDRAVNDLQDRYLQHLSAPAAATLADMGFTANHGRAHFNHRLAIRADDIDELRERLQAPHRGDAASGVHRGISKPGKRPKVAFLFTGQGSQYPGMARGLFASQPSFRKDLEQCDELLHDYLDQPLLDVIFAQPESESLLSQTVYTQPALFALQYALARQWRRWGIEPAAVLGHSVGEYAAACFAGVFSLEQGLTLVAQRARLMQDLPSPGGMIALRIDPERLSQIIDPYRKTVSVSALNGPSNVVVSGLQPDIDAIARTMADQGVKAAPIRVSHAFHSPLMEPMLDQLQQCAARVEYKAPKVPIVSNLTGKFAEPGTYNARYWRDHTRNPVRYSAGLEQLAARGCRAFLEIGPAPVLCGMGKDTIADPEAAWLASLRRNHDDWACMLDALAELYVRGAEVDWAGFDGEYVRRRVDLPSYPFQRERHWLHYPSREIGNDDRAPLASVEPSQTSPKRAAGLWSDTATTSTVLGRRLSSPLAMAQYMSVMTAEDHPGLDENVVDGTAVVNAGYYLEAALACAADLLGTDRVSIRHLLLPQPLVLPEDGRQAWYLLAEPLGDGPVEFRCLSNAADPSSWLLHATGTIHPAGNQSAALSQEEIGLIEQRCAKALSGTEFYRGLWKRHAYLGHSARWLAQIRCGPGEALASLRLPEACESEPYRLHPGITDSVLQLIFACMLDDPPAEDTLIMLAELEDYRYYGHNGEQLACHARLRADRQQSNLLSADITLFTESGRRVAEFSGVHLRAAKRKTLLEAARAVPRPATSGLTSAGTIEPVSARRRPPAMSCSHQAKAAIDLRDTLITSAARILGSSVDQLDRDEPLQNLGFDSLMAVELRDAFARESGLEVPAALFLDNPSLSGLEDTLQPLLDRGNEPRPSRSSASMAERVGPGGMHVAEVGSGPPVIFIHGGAFGGTDAWQLQLPLAERWRLIIPSRLNYGKSASSAGEDYEQDAVLVAQILGDGAHIVAQSYGTISAMLIAAAHPELVWSLTLIESPASSLARGSEAVDEYERGIKALVARPPDHPDERLTGLFAFIEPAARFPSPLTAELRAFAERIPATRWPWDAEIPIEELQRASVPTLVITGGQRPVFEEIGDALAGRLACERLIIPGGHGTQNVGTPFNEALEDFLRRARPSISSQEGLT